MKSLINRTDIVRAEKITRTAFLLNPLALLPAGILRAVCPVSGGSGQTVHQESPKVPVSAPLVLPDDQFLDVRGQDILIQT
ncbi:hypothetical protein KCC72_004650 [Salmonella enterica subsp. enterica serovar Saintpaul]|nr:hypothetical protein [Salmonella enterica]EAT8443831.1 hypothetical protein [Salmonella enterica subsp. enterica serovar Bonariensis]ECA8470913.1 hypothetical protein [Salmonella enterica subsp. enterica serovar Saintpaul]EDR7170264.1 hypothetical protein [Salmonella enterica subsp. houtenae]EDW0018265.1 hypothetical protein [Salmonella enterica subsp. enterica serovar Aba]